MSIFRNADPGLARTILLLLIGLVTGLVIARGLRSSAPGLGVIGQFDFRGYWSASYLLAEGGSFADPDAVLAVQREQTGWRKPYAVMTWNPPWLLALLLPYSRLPFAAASAAWLATNVTLAFLSAIALWQSYARGTAVRRWAVLAPLLFFFFSPLLVALFMGQVNILVLAGLAGALYFDAVRRRPTLAGAALALTTVKPHLIYITLALWLLWWLRRREWRAVAGFSGALAGLTTVVLALRPTFLAEYTRNATGGDLLQWATPTLGGFLREVAGWPAAPLAGLVALPLFIWLWGRRPTALPWPTWVGATVLFSLLTAPFGWSYDALVLLVPITQLVVWAAAGDLGRWGGGAAITLLLAVNLASYGQRLAVTDEVYYVWLPVAVAAIYAASWRWRAGRPPAGAPIEGPIAAEGHV